MGTQGKEALRTQRKVAPILALLALLSAASPTAAPASSLLSGYGDPGQGNQAILGSALLNGSGNAGGGSAGTSGSPTDVTAPLERGTGAPSGSGRPSGAPSGSNAPARRTARGPSKEAAGAIGGASGLASGAYPASEAVGAAQTSGTLGLSGEDLLYVVLVLAALTFMGVLTKRLTRTV
jgi:hypothetical protein